MRGARLLDVAPTVMKPALGLRAQPDPLPPSRPARPARLGEGPIMIGGGLSPAFATGVLAVIALGVLYTWAHW
jgi:hypothetical protein